MSTEIELKYLVNSTNVAEKITRLLNSNEIHYRHSEKLLNNCYFDTPELTLRKHDIGLRIRDTQGQLEQTIKTKGLDIGGLHQRPEYNVQITENCPDLSLFPEEVWPKSLQANKLQPTIVPLFTTHFTRQTWHITLENSSEIELVFDQGRVSSKKQQEDILEIELEVVKGDVNDILKLATLLFDSLALRPGTHSKAARGYALWHGEKLASVFDNKYFIPLSAPRDQSQLFQQGLSYGLKTLQDSVAHYILFPKLTNAVHIYDSLMLLRHGFWLFESVLSEQTLQVRSQLSELIQQFSWVDNAIYLKDLIDKKGNYAKKLAYSQQLIEQLNIENRRFPDEQAVIELLYSPLMNQVQLHILALVISNEKVTIDNNKVTDDVIGFAKGELDKSLDDLIQVMPNALSLSSEQYIAQSKLLHRSLLTGNWLGDLFDRQERKAYRAPWLDIKEGISELQSLWIIQQQLQKLESQPTKLLDWQDSKLDTLLHALDHSRRKAISMSPYWQLV